MSTAGQVPNTTGQVQGGEASGTGNQRPTAGYTGQRRRGWRLEVGFFIRKIVNRRVVSEWQFPRRRRLRAGQVSGSGEPVLQQPSPPPLLAAHDTGPPAEGEPQPLAMHSPAADDEKDDEKSGSTSEETRFETGFFVQSATPPEYMDPPGG